MDRIPILARPGDVESLPIGHITLSDEARENLTHQLINGSEYHLGFWISNPSGDAKLRAVWFCPDPCVSKRFAPDGAEPPPTPQHQRDTMNDARDLSEWMGTDEEVAARHPEVGFASGSKHGGRYPWGISPEDQSRLDAKRGTMPRDEKPPEADGPCGCTG